MSEVAKLFVGLDISEFQAFDLKKGEVENVEGQVFRIPLGDGSSVEVTFEKCFATVQGMKRVEPTGAEVREVIEVLSGLEVSDG